MERKREGRLQVFCWQWRKTERGEVADEFVVVCGVRVVSESVAGELVRDTLAAI